MSHTLPVFVYLAQKQTWKTVYYGEVHNLD